LLEPQKLSLRPALAFGARSRHPRLGPPWVMFLVDPAGTVLPRGDLP
jgi:hypothetical protein